LNEELDNVLDSRFERETMINTSDGEKQWTLETFQRKIITKLKNAEIEPLFIDESSGRHYYKLDFNQVSFRKKSSGNKTPMSQERKDAAKQRFADAREAKKNK
jgi:hypothetical protein